MKLDVNVLRYLSKEEFRVLTAVEMGMKNVRVLLAASLPTWKLSLLHMNKVELADDCLLLLLSLGGGENSFL
jgi:RIO-like serine/threonine protein kinase